MSYSSDDAVKERIREAIDIVDLVQQFVPLKRAGRNYVGRCPWHDDSKPSLQVNPERQTYKCWVCDIGGDVFSFIMKVENVGFKEALEILADKAGIPLPKQEKKIFLKPTGLKPTRPKNNDPNVDPNAELDQLAYSDDLEAPSSDAVEQPREVDRQTLFHAVDWLAKQYHHALLTLEEAEPARKYLRDRKINDESIRKFLIGYAPMERDWIAKKVKNDSKRLQILELVGNLIGPDAEANTEHRTNTAYYDRFRGRVLFPIRDTQDRPVAFGGRVIPGSPLTSKAKYVNSPETPLFSKHRMLYGLESARRKMKDTRRALIMEGYTDCIVAHQFGFEDAVAVLGTALGPEHIRILKRYVDKMLLVLDGDEAGRKRADQVLELFVAQGVDMSVLTLPAGLDPCEFLEENGADAFRMLIDAEATDALDHAFRSATFGIDLEHDVIGSSRALDKLLTIIAQSPTQGAGFDDPQRIRIEKTLQKLSHRFGVTEDEIRRRVKEKRKKIQESPRRDYDSPVEKTVIPDENDVWSSPENLPDQLEREMLELIIGDPTTLYEFWEEVPPERCRSPITKQIYAKCNEMIERNKLPTFDCLIVAFDAPKMKSFLVKLDETGTKKRSVHAPAVVASDEPEAPVVRDELGELDESLKEKDETAELPPEAKAKLVREIIDGFDRRDRTRKQVKEVDQLRGDALTEGDKLQKLLQLQAEQKRLQEEKKKKLGLSE